MKPINIGKGILWGAVFLGSLALAGLIIYELSLLIAYFSVAIIVSLVGRPIVHFLRNKFRFPRILSVLVYLIGVLGTVIASISMFIPMVAEQGKAFLDIRTLRRKIDRLYLKLREMGETGEVVEKVIEDGKLE